MSSSTPPWLAEADGLGVEPPPDGVPDPLAEDADGAGTALSSAPESDEEDLPDVVSDVLSGALSEDAEGVGSAVPADGDALAEADGDGVADASVEPLDLSRTSTHFWYSSAVMVFDDAWSSARARVGVSPIPMRTAVGIAARAIALPAGTWNRVNSGFLGAA
ncbi:hypothetical protein ACWD5Q_22515 [Streptomyces sp. NPDC002513]